tara:strand:- start:649 stop:1077 length:429 start_codon:yes stop_codon:yes gene_type:complete
MDYKYHKTCKICDWKRRGIILREGETYDIFYDKWVKATHCECCNVKLDFSGSGKNGRCLDHDHDTGYFRNILCNCCNHKRINPKDRKTSKNNTSGIPNIRQRIRGNYVNYQYGKTIDKKRHTKYFKTLEEAVEYKTIFENNI